MLRSFGKNAGNKVLRNNLEKAFTKSLSTTPPSKSDSSPAKDGDLPGGKGQGGGKGGGKKGGLPSLPVFATFAGYLIDTYVYSHI
jgi:hypothetical protein